MFVDLRGLEILMGIGAVLMVGFSIWFHKLRSKNFKKVLSKKQKRESCERI